MGIRQVMLVVGLVAAAVAHAAQPADVTPEQLQRIEALSCRSWHARGIARHRVIPDEELSGADAQDGKLHVAFSCEPYDSSGAWSVRDEGNCAGNGLDWSCDAPWAGVFRDHDAGTYEAALTDTPVTTAVRMLEHLIGKARHGADWAKYGLDAYLRITPFGEDGRTWHLEYEWTDAEQHTWASIIEVHGRCRQDGCHFRSKYLTTYSLLRM